MGLTTAELLTVTAVSLFMAACDEKVAPNNEVFTLYTNAPSDQAFRIGIATFDSHGPFSENNEFRNQKYCQEAAAMFQAKWEQATVALTDPGVRKVRHWCEKGRYTK